MDQLSELKMGLSVTAMAHQGRERRSVGLRRKGRSLELQHLEQADTWLALAKRAKVLDESGRRLRVSHHDVVVGLDSVGVAFYRMTLPKVGTQETDAMVRMQTETRLPLGVDQMGLDWKTVDCNDSECTATVAAMRKNSPGVTDVVALEPDHIILEADALVQMWRWGCNRETPNVLLMSCCEHYTVLCCVRDYQLVHASVLDLGLSDIVPPDTVFEAMSPLNSGPMEQFIRDLKSSMQQYHEEHPECPAVTLLTDGSDALQAIVQAMTQADLEVNEAMPNEAAFSGHIAFGVTELYAWRVPIGLALCALNEHPSHYELFKDLCGRLEKKQTSKVRPFLPWVAVCVAICLLIGTLYTVDVKRHEKLTSLTNAPEVAQFQEEKAYQSMVARQRANMLELINVVTSKEHKGIILDKFTYKKGQPLKIAGRADKSEPWYKFEEAMTNLKGVAQAKRDNLVLDEKGKKVKFGMSFHYKTYTRKVTQ
ncbi:MAG: hypothetical protein HQ515_04420 [Phycisphaeraceae bacterium]|nr:hypothetical protein [Phycisphaeraceae bacterium]